MKKDGDAQIRTGNRNFSGGFIFLTLYLPHCISRYLAFSRFVSLSHMPIHPTVRER